MRGPLRRAVAVGALVSCVVGPSSAPAHAATDFAAVACSLPHDQLLRIWRGTDPDRSGQILTVPKEPNFMGSNFPHSGPWDYLQNVPMLWYGPGYLKPQPKVERPVTIAGIAPTQAGLLGFDGFHAPDGVALPEVLAAAKDTPPKLIVTMVWDAGGRSVLDTWPKDWPVLKSLIPKGIWYDHASVGSSPSITPATHATIGTGAYPQTTGEVDAEFRLGDSPTLIRSGDLGPTLLDSATLADVYDRAMGNEPVVGDLASVTWHLNMMGHGAMWNGGDKDIAVLRLSDSSNGGEEGDAWKNKSRNAPWYRFPAYVNDLPTVDTYTAPLDRADGAIDGRWRQNSIEQLAKGWDTPARVPFQDRMYAEVIKREGFGADDVPDLLFINSKIIDHVGHVWSVNSPEMQDTLHWQDAGLREFIGTLNDEVGRGNWVMVLTADHGHQFDPAVSGAFQISPSVLQSDLEARFDDGDGTSDFIGVRTSQTFLNMQEVARSGQTVEEIADFILHYTKAQASVSPSGLSAAEQGDEVFSAVFPSSVFEHPLPCLPEAGP
ncbi:MAG: alkaline phosphatase family protein [Actinomycetota bacterium]